MEHVIQIGQSEHSMTLAIVIGLWRACELIQFSQTESQVFLELWDKGVWLSSHPEGMEGMAVRPGTAVAILFL